MAGGSLSFLDEALASASARLTGWRRDLHRFPEAGWTEFRTAALAIARLREWGFTIRMG